MCSLFQDCLLHAEAQDHPRSLGKESQRKRSGEGCVSPPLPPSGPAWAPSVGWQQSLMAARVPWNENGLNLRCAGKVGTPCRQSRGIDPPVSIRRGEGAQMSFYFYFFYLLAVPRGLQDLTSLSVAVPGPPGNPPQAFSGCWSWDDACIHHAGQTPSGRPPGQMAWLVLALPPQRPETPWLGWWPRGVAASCARPRKDRPSPGHAHLRPSATCPTLSF